MTPDNIPNINKSANEKDKSFFLSITFNNAINVAKDNKAIGKWTNNGCNGISINPLFSL